MRRVVVTGLGLVTPLSNDVNDFWERSLKSESGVSRIDLIDTSEFKIKIGGQIKDWDLGDRVDKREAKRLDRFAQFSLAAAQDAVSDAGINFQELDAHRCGCILGSGIGGLNTIEEQLHKLFYKGPGKVSPFTIPALMLNAGGGNISIEYGLKGPNFSVATACASANNAIGEALRIIQHDEADLIISGGTEAALCRMGLAAFGNMRALSPRNDDPTSASRPFDQDRDGFVLAEGAGVFILEELEHAKRRNANIYCEIAGFGCTADAGHITQPDENGIGAGRAIQQALDDARITPAEIDYINAHGTSTPLGDKAETQAIKNVFGDHAYKVSISSTKSVIGHSLGASGGIELIATSLAIRDSVVPPTANLDTPDPACDLDYTPKQPKERVINYALSNSFGFGGHNACVIVKKPD
ncbi:MAG: beta-ketoacyl-ACP synthase II [Planctomycetota bacterium]|jgi:3-oxoacyl-[acyl-carrier-protein] synthase II|nr:beta-ketoacyl-ACP synthase II [Planctomycetota bacterium]